MEPSQSFSITCFPHAFSPSLCEVTEVGTQRKAKLQQHVLAEPVLNNGFWLHSMAQTYSLSLCLGFLVHPDPIRQSDTGWDQLEWSQITGQAGPAESVAHSHFFHPLSVSYVEKPSQEGRKTHKACWPCVEQVVRKACFCRYKLQSSAGRRAAPFLKLLGSGSVCEVSFCLLLTRYQPSCRW